MNIDANSMHRMCLRKKCYKTEEFALVKAKLFEKKFNVKNRVYFCPLCGYFHITTKKEEKHESITR